MMKITEQKGAMGLTAEDRLELFRLLGKAGYQVVIRRTREPGNRSVKVHIEAIGDDGK